LVQKLNETCHDLRELNSKYHTKDEPKETNVLLKGYSQKPSNPNELKKESTSTNIVKKYSKSKRFSI
jgi:hypothetical protein